MFDADRAADTFAAYREWALDEPDESNTAVVLAQMPPVPEVPEPVRGRRVLMLRAFHLGAPPRRSARSRRCGTPPGRRCSTACARPRTPTPP